MNEPILLECSRCFERWYQNEEVDECPKCGEKEDIDFSTFNFGADNDDDCDQ